MSSKVDVFPIVKNHFATLRNNANDKASLSDWLLHLAAPTILSIGFLIFPVDLASKFGNIIAALAIIFGFAFAATIFVFQLRMQMAEMQVSSKQAAIAEIAPQIDINAPLLVNELFSNCLYAVLLSGVATATAASLDLLGSPMRMSVILIWLVAHLIIVLLMCFKRLNAAFAKVTK